MKANTTTPKASQSWTKEGARTVYVEIPEFDGDFDEAEMWNEDLEAVVRECLPPSFYPTGFRWSRHWDGPCIVRNKLFVVFLADNETSIAVNVMPHPDTEYPELAKAQLFRVSEAFFDRLSEHYQLHIRNTAWTSSPRTPTKSVSTPHLITKNATANPGFARVTFSNGDAVFSFGKWIGDQGYSGLLILDAEPGDVVATGQRDNRKRMNSAAVYQVVQEDGTLSSPISKKDAFLHYGARENENLALGNTQICPGDERSCA